MFYFILFYLFIFFFTISNRVSALCLQAERRAYREAEISVMDDISEAGSHKEDDPVDPGSLAPPPSQQHTDPASPTVAVTPEPVVRGEQATPSEIEYQVVWVDDNSSVLVDVNE